MLQFHLLPRPSSVKNRMNETELTAGKSRNIGIFWYLAFLSWYSRKVKCFGGGLAVKFRVPDRIEQKAFYLSETSET